MFGVLLDARQRHLVRTPQPLELVSVDIGWSSPTLWRAQDNHWPSRPPGSTAASNFLLERRDFLNAVVKGGGHCLVHAVAVGSLHEKGLITIALKQVFQFLVA